MGSGDRLWEIRLKAGVGRFVRFVYAERGGWGVGGCQLLDDSL